MRGAPSFAGWRRPATTWSQWSEPQAPANWNRAARCGLGGHLSFCRGRSRASTSDGNANLPYPVGYASGIIVIDHMRPWRRGDALHIAAIRRCLRHAILQTGAGQLAPVLGAGRGV
jgi:hypothetical protein